MNKENLSINISIPSKSNNLDSISITTNVVNLFDIDIKRKESKVAMSLYIEEEDLNLLKAIAINNNITVNKLILEIMKPSLDYTKDNLPKGFNIDKLANQYDKHKRCKKNK